MATLVGTTQGTVAAGGSFTVTLPAGIQRNDLILLWGACASSTSAPIANYTVPGWTSLATTQVGNVYINGAQGWYTPTLPLTGFVAGSGAPIAWVTQVWRGTAKLYGTPISASDSNNTTTMPTGSPTTWFYTGQAEMMVYAWTSAATISGVASGSTIDATQANGTAISIAVGHNNNLNLPASTGCTAFSQTLSAANANKVSIAIIVDARMSVPSTPDTYGTNVKGTTGIRHYWRFTEFGGAPNFIFDYIGVADLNPQGGGLTTSNNTGSPANAVLGGTIGQDTELSGSSRWGTSFGDTEIIGTPPSAWSFEGWFWVDPSAVDGCLIVSAANQTQHLGWNLRLTTSPSLSVIADIHGGGSVTSTSAAAITASAWHHIVLTYTGTTASLYVDGAFKASVSKAISPCTNVYQFGLAVGSSAVGENLSTPGYYDECAWYDVALSAATILAHYNIFAFQGSAVGQGGATATLGFLNNTKGQGSATAKLTYTAANPVEIVKFIGYTSGTVSTAGPFNFTFPAGIQVGDFVIVYMVTDGTATPVTFPPFPYWSTGVDMSGVNGQGTGGNPNGSVRSMQTWYTPRVQTTLQNPTGGNTIWICAVWRGVNGNNNGSTATNWDGTFGVSSTTINTPSQSFNATSGYPGDQEYFFWSWGNNSAITPPAGVTVDTQVNHPSLGISAAFGHNNNQYIPSGTQSFGVTTFGTACTSKAAHAVRIASCLRIPPINDYYGRTILATPALDHYYRAEGFNNSFGMIDYGPIFNGAAYAGSVNIAVATPAPLGGTGLKINTSGSRFYVPGPMTNVDVQDPYIPWSMEFWCNIDPTNTLDNAVIAASHSSGLDDALTHNTGWLIRLLASTQQVYLQFSDANQACYFSGTASLPFGVWHHVVLTYDGAAAKLYIDGKLVVWYNTPWVPVISQYQPSVGNSCNAVTPTLGVIGIYDEIAWYSDDLSPDVILAHYLAAPFLTGNITAQASVTGLLTVPWPPGNIILTGQGKATFSGALIAKPLTPNPAVAQATATATPKVGWTTSSRALAGAQATVQGTLNVRTGQRTATTGTAAASASFTITPPTGIIAGDFIFVVTANAAGSTTPTPPTGWTAMGQLNNTNTLTNIYYALYDPSLTMNFTNVATALAWCCQAISWPGMALSLNAAQTTQVNSTNSTTGTQATQIGPNNIYGWEMMGWGWNSNTTMSSPEINTTVDATSANGTTISAAVGHFNANPAISSGGIVGTSFTMAATVRYKNSHVFWVRALPAFVNPNATGQGGASGSLTIKLPNSVVTSSTTNSGAPVLLVGNVAIESVPMFTAVANQALGIYDVGDRPCGDLGIANAPYTFLALVRPTVTTGWRGIFQNGDGAGVAGGGGFWVGANNGDICANVGAGNTGALSGYTLTLNQWNLVGVVIRSATAQDIYIYHYDTGVWQATHTSVGMMPNPPLHNTGYIGDYFDGTGASLGEYFGGDIAWLGLWSSDLGQGQNTPAAIKQFIDSGPWTRRDDPDCTFFLEFSQNLVQYPDLSGV